MAAAAASDTVVVLDSAVVLDTVVAVASAVAAAVALDMWWLRNVHWLRRWRQQTSLNVPLCGAVPEALLVNQKHPPGSLIPNIIYHLGNSHLHSTFQSFIPFDEFNPQKHRDPKRLSCQSVISEWLFTLTLLSFIFVFFSWHRSSSRVQIVLKSMHNEKGANETDKAWSSSTSSG